MDIEKSYNDFWELVKDDDTFGKGMGASMESLQTFINYVHNYQATINDAGAGCSTYVLNEYFANVTSYDPDVNYLGKLKRLFKYTPSTEIKEADFTFYDYGNVERVPYMETFLNATRIGMYIDDAHDWMVMDEVNRLIKKYKHKIITFDTDKDIQGRYGLMILK